MRKVTPPVGLMLTGDNVADHKLLATAAAIVCILANRKAGLELDGYMTL
jgi:hypothetical protein